MPAGDTLANRHTLLAAPTLSRTVCASVFNGLACLEWLGGGGCAPRGEGTLDGTMRRCFVAGLLFSDWKVLV